MLFKVFFNVLTVKSQCDDSAVSYFACTGIGGIYQSVEFKLVYKTIECRIAYVIFPLISLV